MGPRNDNLKGIPYSEGFRRLSLPRVGRLSPTQGAETSRLQVSLSVRQERPKKRRLSNLMK